MTLVAATVAAAAVVLTYLCCIRPMRRGGCAMTAGTRRARWRDCGPR
jgi:hypothetical protein